MALKRVWTTKPIAGLPVQHPATIIVGDVVGLAPSNSLKVKITHSHHPKYPVGSLKLLCGKRCMEALMMGDRVLDSTSMKDVTPEPVPKGRS